MESFPEIGKSPRDVWTFKHRTTPNSCLKKPRCSSFRLENLHYPTPESPDMSAPQLSRNFVDHPIPRKRSEGWNNDQNQLEYGKGGDEWKICDTIPASWYTGLLQTVKRATQSSVGVSGWKEYYFSNLENCSPKTLNFPAETTYWFWCRILHPY